MAHTALVILSLLRRAGRAQLWERHADAVQDAGEPWTRSALRLVRERPANFAFHCHLKVERLRSVAGIQIRAVQVERAVQSVLCGLHFPCDAVPEPLDFVELITSLACLLQSRVTTVADAECVRRQLWHGCGAWALPQRRPDALCGGEDRGLRVGESGDETLGLWTASLHRWPEAFPRCGVVEALETVPGGACATRFLQSDASLIPSTTGGMRAELGAPPMCSIASCTSGLCDTFFSYV